MFLQKIGLKRLIHMDFFMISFCIFNTREITQILFFSLCMCLVFFNHYYNCFNSFVNSCSNLVEAPERLQHITYLFP